MKAYKQRIYSNYHSTHTKHLYGEVSIEKIKNHFPVYEYYYGKHVNNNKNVSVLELGCGYGDFVYWLLNKGYNNVKGIDYSEEQIKIGTSLGIPGLICDDIFNFFEEDNSTFDLIILRDVLEHFDSDETYKLVSQLNNKLDKKGTIILQVPNGQSPFVGKILFGDFTHHNAFTESSINQLFKSSGFNAIKVFETTPVPKNFKGLLRLFLWQIEKLYLKLLQLIATGDGSGLFSQNIIAVIKK